jgi:predicted phosphoadenosine phosphosulfate sulfurtransferase
MIVQRDLGVDVLTAARQRIRNIFGNGLPVYMGFSGGKDSLVLADLTAKLAQTGEIDVSRLTVEFVDEEAIFPCVEEIVRQWREKFLLLGAKFCWYCVEVRHFNCLNQLENDESFICWDRRKADCWVRDMPSMAIRSHPLLVPRKDSYQEFLAKVCDGPRMTGLRVAESIQRRIAIAGQKPITDLAQRATVEPIYDWRNDDVWRYLHENDIRTPVAYQHLYQIGVPVNQLRISQFFSVDTAYVLARMSEYYPHLMERVLRREPAAYMVSLYWDSEMFRRRTRKRREIEKKSADDKREKVWALLRDIERNFSTPKKRAVAEQYRRLLLRKPYVANEHYEKIYDALIAGDPKRRSFRAIFADVERSAADAFVPGNATFSIADTGALGRTGVPGTAKTKSLQSKYRARGKPGAADAVDLDKRLDIADRSAA